MSDRKSPQNVDEELTNCGISSLSADIYHLLDGFLAREEFQAFLQVNKQVHGEYIGYRYISLSRKIFLALLGEREFQRENTVADC